MGTHLRELTIVRVGFSVSYSSLKLIGDQILETFHGAIERYLLRHLPSPYLEKVDAYLLTQILDQEIGAHVLGISDADLTTTEEAMGWVFGAKSSTKPVVVVSTRRLVPDNVPRHGRYRLMLSRILKEALHEIGHNFGLPHHYTYRQSSDGRLCPMSKGRYNQFGEHGYLRSVIDARGTAFCGECLRLLRIGAS